MRKLIQVAALAGATIVMTAAAASASVSFDSATGTGFVGKGDVQLAFGWNNKAAQDNAKVVAFSYDATDTYDVTCEWDTTTGNGGIVHHDVTVPKHTVVNSAVAYDARMKNQYTGYILQGFGATVSGVVPAIGDDCPGNSGGQVTGIERTSSTGGGLSVTFGGTTVPLPNTPVL